MVFFNKKGGKACGVRKKHTILSLEEALTTLYTIDC